MTQQKAGNLLGGAILIGLGMLFLLFQMIPGLGRLLRIELFWPLIIIAGGAFFLLMALLTRTPPLAIPGCIVGGIGCLLFMQNVTGYWESWSFVWALIPGFVGVGLILSGLLGDRPAEQLHAGGKLLLISAALFLVFGAFLGPFGFLSNLWPLLLIGAGLVLLARVLLQSRPA
jgi:hypothetical protein